MFKFKLLDMKLKIIKQLLNEEPTIQISIGNLKRAIPFDK